MLKICQNIESFKFQYSYDPILAQIKIRIIFKNIYTVNFRTIKSFVLLEEFSQTYTVIILCILYTD